MPQNHSINNNPRKLRRVVIKEELVILTGHWLKALILNQFLFWEEHARWADDYIREEHERTPGTKIELTHGWIYKSAQQLRDDLMLDGVSHDSIRHRLDDLVEHGWLSRRHNPENKWDRTYQYRPDIRKIQHDLQQLGYVLDGYPLFETGDATTPDASPITHSASPITHSASSITPGASSITPGASAIPENKDKRNLLEMKSSTTVQLSPTESESTIHFQSARAAPEPPQNAPEREENLSPTPSQPSTLGWGIAIDESDWGGRLSSLAAPSSPEEEVSDRRASKSECLPSLASPPEAQAGESESRQLALLPLPHLAHEKSTKPEKSSTPARNGRGEGGAAAAAERKPNLPYRVYERLLEIEPGLRKGETLRDVKKLLDMGWHPRDIIACAKWLASDPWYQERGVPITSDQIYKRIAPWERLGKPDVYEDPDNNWYVRRGILP